MFRRYLQAFIVFQLTSLLMRNLLVKECTQVSHQVSVLFGFSYKEEETGKNRVQTLQNFVF